MSRCLLYSTQYGGRGDKRKRRKRSGPYVVVSGGPGRVELHVELSLFSGQLVVLGLLLPGQCMPLETQIERETVSILISLSWMALGAGCDSQFGELR